MRITYEKHKSLDLIYIYIREFDGIIVNTISDLEAELFLDEESNWIGIEVYNNFSNEGKIDLPKLFNPYKVKDNEKVVVENQRIFILFDSDKSISSRIKVHCNIDYNDVNGLQGIELILANFTVKIDIAKKFINKANLLFGGNNGNSND